MRATDTILMALLAGSVMSGCSHRAEKIGLKLVQPASVAANDQVGEVIDRGRHHLDDRNFALAISQFREALRLDPEQAAAHNGLAVAYASIGRADLARRHFERAVAYGASDPTYERNYARFLGTVEASAGAALAQAGGDGGARHGAAMTGADGSWQLPVPAGPAPDERSAGSPRLVDASGVAMLLTGPRAASAQPARPRAAEPRYDLAAFGLAPHGIQASLQRTSLYEVRLVTMASTGPAIAADAAPGVVPYSNSAAEASFWGAVDRSRARAKAVAQSAGGDGTCTGEARYVPRWAVQLTVSIRQCSA